DPRVLVEDVHHHALVVRVDDGPVDRGAEGPGSVAADPAAEDDLHDRMDAQVDEVAVELDSLLNPRSAHITLLVPGRVDQDIDDWWRTWWDVTSESCSNAGLDLQAFAVRRTSEVTVAEYRRMITVPLTPISPERLSSGRAHSHSAGPGFSRRQSRN